MTLLASQAAVAIENARLFESAKRWSDRLESLIEVGNALATEDELPRMLDLVARRLREILHARFVVIFLRTDGDLRLEAAAGEVDVAVGNSTSISGTKAGRVLERGRSERIDSVMEDPGIRSRADPGARDADGALRAAAAPDGGDRNHRRGRQARHRTCASRARIFASPRHIASRAAVAADQARRVQRDAFRRVVHAQEEERRRLARELHDETGQALASILLGLKTLEEAGDVAELRDRVAALRRVSSRPSRTCAASRSSCVRPRSTTSVSSPRWNDWCPASRSKPASRLSSSRGFDDDRLPQEVETVLYRIVQEALTNVVKHADAGRVSIVVTQTSRVGGRDRRGRRPGLRSRSGDERRYRAHRDAGARSNFSTDR